MANNLLELMANKHWPQLTSNVVPMNKEKSHGYHP